MSWDDLFSNLKIGGELLAAMIPAIDSKLLVFASGIILGILETNGYANPHNHQQNLDALSQFLGSAITVITIVSYYAHDAVIHKNKLKYGNPSVAPLESQQVTSGIVSKIKAFIFTPLPKDPVS